MPYGREIFWVRELQYLKTEFEIFGSALPPQDVTKEPFFRIEKAMYYSAFTLRKLIEASRISKELKKLRLNCEVHPSQDQPQVIDGIVSFCYGSYAVTHKTFLLRQVCDELVHAADFMVIGYVDNLIFASDKNMKTRYLSLKLSDWLAVINKAISIPEV